MRKVGLHVQGRVRMILNESAIFLGAAVVAVPLFKRAGLGSVLGYLAAGALIGPSGIGLIHDVHETLHFAEFGVVLLLFLIGLELQPARLWRMRSAVFGTGGSQVVATTAVLAGAGLALGLEWRAALVAGFGLSMSSTAFVLQLLAEKREMATGHGRASLAVLLFQDIAAIPALALIPLLAVTSPDATDGSPWVAILRVVGVIVGLVVAGRVLLRPALRFIASARSHELSTASALLVVIATSLLMQWVGLSAALGAFMAGVLLADSEYRHELEANIEPFKGLLLGLFFMAVGMSAHLGVVLEHPLRVLGLVVLVVGAKFGVLYAIGRRTGLVRREAASLGIALSQGGEFAFVIFGIAATAGVMPEPLVETLVVVVTLSMVTTPLLFMARERVLARLAASGAQRDFDEIPDEGSRVIIAGFGRFGQMVARMLSVKRIGFTALEVSPEHVDFVRKFGNRIYYGDAARVDLLRAAHADRAELFVLCIDDMEASIRTARVVQEHFPNLRIIARARNRPHAYALLGMGIDVVVRETLLGSLDAARHALVALGVDPSGAASDVARFAEYDENQVRRTFGARDDQDALIANAKRYAKELEELFERDETSDPVAAGDAPQR